MRSTLIGVLVLAGLAGLANATEQVFCQAAASEPMLRVVIVGRFANYAGTGDRWSPAASRLVKMVDAGEINFDSMQGRMLRYCSKGDAEMAGLVMGEWIGLLLGLEHGGLREGDDARQ